MAEQTRAAYQRLFEVRLLHHYWLDDGATRFDDLPAQARTRRLLRYDIRQVLAVTPAASTADLLSGLGGVFRATGAGFVAAVPGDTVVDLATRFEFYVVPVSADLTNYTALSLRPRPVTTVIDPATGRATSHQEGVPLLSNRTGVKRALAGEQHLFLSSPYATGPGVLVEDLIVADGVLRQLTGDQPGVSDQALGPVDDLPAYVHQDDAPPGGVEVTPDMPGPLFAVIRLFADRPGDTDFSLVDATGHARATPPVFEARLKNRATTRRYRKRSDGTVSTEAAPSPLTYFGNAGTKRKPVTDGIRVERDAAPPHRITGLVSEIFV